VKAEGVREVDVEDIVSQGRRLGVWEGSVDVGCGCDGCWVVVVGGGMSSSQGGRGRGVVIVGGCGGEGWGVCGDD
jgi:hypothetical protein